MAQLHVLPKSHRRINQQKKSTAEPVKVAQLVSNFSAYATPNIVKTILTLGKILNTNEVFNVAPVLSLGEGSTIDLLKNLEKPRKTHLGHVCEIPNISTRQRPNL